jgi:hypothetical protein
MPTVQISRLSVVRLVAWTIVALCMLLVTTFVVRDVMATDRSDEARVELDDSAAVLVLDHDGFRYTYHLISGTEGLFDISHDRATLINLNSDRPRMCRRFREMLEAREKVADLSDLRERYRNEIEGLRALGYL